MQSAPSCDEGANPHLSESQASDLGGKCVSPTDKLPPNHWKALLCTQTITLSSRATQPECVWLTPKSAVVNKLSKQYSQWRVW